ncbi:unnamed protein product [Rangifer tarandus platyrhynchus]|uniref:Uncharacterized protein n=3 Tax=Rangifer tarandus platyrhynchus TaxID=3082113 RepID=A0ACB0FB02_RANTA|nr:unnamed protein product [Rangifer tarandus platyrhynchus]CAI9709884.1 unnamed protein product [Rangifer tarandus platyrhynchus]
MYITPTSILLAKASNMVKLDISEWRSIVYAHGNERKNRKQKLSAAPAAFAPQPGTRKLQDLRAPAARPRRVRAPRASRLAPRATSPPRPRAPRSCLLGGAGLGVVGGSPRRWSPRCTALCTPASRTRGG